MPVAASSSSTFGFEFGNQSDSIKYTFDTKVGTIIAATIQLLSLLPDPHWGFPTDTPMLELDQSENPWRNGLARQPFQVRGGYVNVPTKPGLGIEVDEGVVKKYVV